MTLTKPKVAMLNLDVTGTEILTTSTDASSAAGPVQSFFRDSVSPAANDLLAYLKFDGRDTGGNRQNYASLSTQILDPAIGSEDGALSFATWVAGVDTVTMTLRDGRVGVGNSLPLAKLHVGAGTDVSIGLLTPGLLVEENGVAAISVRNATNDKEVQFGANTTYTYNYAYGATFDHRHFFGVNGTVLGFWRGALDSTYTGGAFVIAASSYAFNDPQQIGAQFHGNPYPGGTSAPGTLAITNSGPYNVLSVNRSSGDGELVAWYSAGSFIGNITCSGGVVSYNAFSGSHWSQLEDQSKQEIFRGTIVETINEMCSWEGEEPDFEEHLPKFKISDQAGSKQVYGVFMDWMHKGKQPSWGEDGGEFLEDDALITSLGACMIRIEAGATVENGDLIESAGNGCGRVQPDDVFRSSTVAKVTASVIIETYSDGSYLVPCTLHCG